jgi:hypothetical protein
MKLIACKIFDKFTFSREIKKKLGWKKLKFAFLIIKSVLCHFGGNLSQNKSKNLSNLDQTPIHYNIWRRTEHTEQNVMKLFSSYSINY